MGPKKSNVAGPKRSRSNGIDANGYESESEPSRSSSNGSGSDYAPHAASDDSDDSDNPELLSRPVTKRSKKSSSTSRAKRSTPAKVTPSRRVKQPRKKKLKTDKSMPESASLDQNEGPYAIPTGERNSLVNNLTRERARRMLEAIELPNVDELSPDEYCTAHQLLTRGCMPAIPMHWAKDFSTLPESLFFSVKENESIHREGEFVLEVDKGTEFYAMRAFRDLLNICGIVRDHCNILEGNPERSIQKSIQKYIRWALDDAHVRIQPTTIPVYMIYSKKRNEGAKATFPRAFKDLEDLATTWRSHIPSSSEPTVWPSVMGFVICGPVLSVVTLDCNPNPSTKGQGIRLLGQFDLSDLNHDVWNTLALAISVMHIKRTITKISGAYKLPFAASIVEDARGSVTDVDI